MEKTSKSGNVYHAISAVVNNGVTKDGTWWNLKIMDNLYNKIKEVGAEQVVKKFGYAKFVGIASQSEWKGEDGQTRTSNDMLVNAIELQNGTYIKPDDTRGDPENRDEDIPF